MLASSGSPKVTCQPHATSSGRRGLLLGDRGRDRGRTSVSPMPTVPRPRGKHYTEALLEIRAVWLQLGALHGHEGLRFVINVLDTGGAVTCW